MKTSREVIAPHRAAGSRFDAGAVAGFVRERATASRWCVCTACRRRRLRPIRQPLAAVG